MTPWSLSYFIRDAQVLYFFSLFFSVCMCERASDFGRVSIMPLFPESMQNICRGS